MKTYSLILIFKESESLFEIIKCSMLSIFVDQPELDSFTSSYEHLSSVGKITVTAKTLIRQDLILKVGELLDFNKISDYLVSGSNCTFPEVHTLNFFTHVVRVGKDSSSAKQNLYDLVQTWFQYDSKFEYQIVKKFGDVMCLIAHSFSEFDPDMIQAVREQTKGYHTFLSEQY